MAQSLDQLYAVALTPDVSTVAVGGWTGERRGTREHLLV